MLRLGMPLPLPLPRAARRQRPSGERRRWGRHWRTQPGPEPAAPRRAQPSRPPARSRGREAAPARPGLSRRRGGPATSRLKGRPVPPTPRVSAPRAAAGRGCTPPPREDSSAASLGRAEFFGGCSWLFALRREVAGGVCVGGGVRARPPCPAWRARAWTPSPGFDSSPCSCPRTPAPQAVPTWSPAAASPKAPGNEPSRRRELSGLLVQPCPGQPAYCGKPGAEPAHPTAPPRQPPPATLLPSSALGAAEETRQSWALLYISATHGLRLPSSSSTHGITTALSPIGLLITL